MRFEKISDNQIKCTLTSADLQDRHIAISELTYGGDKARNLFDEMLEKAFDECQFDTEDYPVMIEAVPVSSESLVLLITRMDDPEELDPRFSQFSPEHKESDPVAGLLPSEEPKIGADDFLKLLQDAITQTAPASEKSEPEKEPVPEDVSLKVYRFRDLDSVSDAARAVAAVFHGTSSLYKSPKGSYYLTLHLAEGTPEDFNRACNILSEYAESIKDLPAGDAYYSEHCELLVGEHAIPVFSEL